MRYLTEKSGRDRIKAINETPPGIRSRFSDLLTSMTFISPGSEAYRNLKAERTIGVGITFILAMAIGFTAYFPPLMPFAVFLFSMLLDTKHAVSCLIVASLIYTDASGTLPMRIIPVLLLLWYAGIWIYRIIREFLCGLFKPTVFCGRPFTYYTNLQLAMLIALMAASILQLFSSQTELMAPSLFFMKAIGFLIASAPAAIAGGYLSKKLDLFSPVLRKAMLEKELPDLSLIIRSLEYPPMAVLSAGFLLSAALRQTWLQTASGYIPAVISMLFINAFWRRIWVLSVFNGNNGAEAPRIYY